jgi:Cu2+-exporting ATPase
MMHMDLPVALALTAGTAWGAYKTIFAPGTGEIYFESLTAVILLLLVGRWLQHRHQLSAHDAVELLYSVTSNTARLLDETGESKEVPVEALTEGARVELRAGDSVPADGVILRGESEFDCSMLTGESRPITLGEGERVFAGAVNLSRRVVMRAEATGPQTRVGRLMSLVEQFAADRPPIVRLADRVAHWFVIIVVALAVLTCSGWIALELARGASTSEAVSAGIEHAVALLIVTCPCALGLATPLAVVAAVGRAAGKGIFIKGGETIERLAARGTIYLDKTGTITQGRTELLRWRGDDALKALVAAAERSVAHPIAHAFGAAFGEEEWARHAVESTQILGSGVEARVDEHDLIIGSPRFVSERVAALPEWAHEEIASCADAALTPVLVALEGEVRAVAGLGDPLHDDAAQSVQRLRDLGWRVRILSGDHEGVVRAVARDLDIPAEDCEGGASPERKAEVVRATMRQGTPVIMVGDGVNDAAALAAATVGVAVSGGAEASLTAADAFLREDGLGPILSLIEGGRRAVGVIQRNLGVSLLYNVVTASLAISGVINPMIAAVIMPISSLSVVTLSYRARTF